MLTLSVVLVLGSCFAVPAEDIAETPYDESESLRYEMTSPLSADVGPEPDKAPRIVLVGRSDSLTTHRHASVREECRELAPHRIADSVVILDHSLRC